MILVNLLLTLLAQRLQGSTKSSQEVIPNFNHSLILLLLILPCDEETVNVLLLGLAWLSSQILRYLSPKCYPSNQLSFH